MGGELYELRTGSPVCGRGRSGPDRSRRPLIVRLLPATSPTRWLKTTDVSARRGQLSWIYSSGNSRASTRRSST